jgi:hypothetical protein
MMEKEAAAQVDVTAAENTVKGKWYSNPQPEAMKAVAQRQKQEHNGSNLPKIGSQLPMNEMSEKGEKGKKKRKEPEPDAFDAW